VDEVLTLEDLDLPSAAIDWQEELSDRMAQIVDRKRSSTAGREESLSAYVRILTAKYAAEELQGKSEELVSAFLKSIKAESSEKETVLALKGLYRFLKLLDQVPVINASPSSYPYNHYHALRDYIRPY
jgi:Interferon-related developmental regulator (IFRD)